MNRIPTGLADAIRTSPLWAKAKRRVPSFVTKAKPYVHRMLLLHRFRNVDPSLATVEIGGAKILLDRSNLHDYRQWELAQMPGGDHEAGVTNAILERLRPGDTFVDVGANNGYFTAIAGRRVGPAGTVWAFEPSPGSRERLRWNVRVNRLESIVRVEPCALGDSERKAHLTQDELEDGWNCVIDPAQIEGPVPEGRVPVFVKTLDSYGLSIQGFKIDAEGYEAQILHGARATIERSPGVWGIVEWNPANQHRVGPILDSLFDEAREIVNRPPGLRTFRYWSDLEFVNLLVWNR